jgi:trehalose 6-phosphate synthase/phosphatase
MSPETKKANHQKLFRYVMKYTAAFWGRSFVKELKRVTGEVVLRKVPRLSHNSVLSAFKNSQRNKIIFLDYDGTLTSLHKLPEFAKPSASLLDLLRKLTSIPNVYVYILSGRPREYLDRWFKDLEIGLSGEHGCFFKHPPKMSSILEARRKEFSENLQRVSSSSSIASSEHPGQARRVDSSSWFALVDLVDNSWRSTIRPLLAHYTERTPGSLIEEKEINLTWHYRNADPQFGKMVL